ncbi:MAG: stage III sporulation protein AF [Clostridia bacterium]|nr:stage III sporulation protein AF [Clostridia bacterium]
MKEYIYCIMALTLFVGICRILSPEGRVKKYVSFVGSLCVVSAILMPLGSIAFAEDIFSDIEYEEDIQSVEALWEYYDTTQKNVCEKDTEDRLEGIISSELEVSSDLFDVDITLQDAEDSFVISDARVIIRKDGIGIDPHAVKRIVFSLLSVECEIIYDMK